MPNDYRCTLRSVYSLTAHLVLVTKYRRQVLDSLISNRLEEIFQDICSHSGCILKEFNAQLDHVHLLISYCPQTQLNKLVADIKLISTRSLHKEFSEHFSYYYRRQRYLWNGSYFISSCGYVTDEQLKKYVEKQPSFPEQKTR